MTLHPNAKDMTGLTFGRLTVIAPTDERDDGQIIWLCRCSCGVTVSVRSCSLRVADTRSCGCLQREEMSIRASGRAVHGHARGGIQTRSYVAWRGMLRRCLNPKCKYFERYGGRGITVCERWKSFADFFADMGECAQGMTIERLNNDGNYTKDNCKWATQHEQTRNTSSNRLLTFNGTTLCVTDWATRIGISRDTITSRLRYRWTVERTLSEPVTHNRPRKQLRDARVRARHGSGAHV